MSTEDLRAEMEAAYEIEWVRNDLLRQLSALAGKAHVKSLWQIGWITGHKAGLEMAKQLRAP
jgi:hypothetical protein